MTSATEILKNRIQQYTIFANFLRSEGRKNEPIYTTEQVVDILEDILGEVKDDKQR